MGNDFAFSTKTAYQGECHNAMEGFLMTPKQVTKGPSRRGQDWLSRESVAAGTWCRPIPIGPADQAIIDKNLFILNNRLSSFTAE